MGAEEEVGWGFESGGIGGRLVLRNDACLVFEGEEVLFHGPLLVGAHECLVVCLAEEVVDLFLDISLTLI